MSTEKTSAPKDAPTKTDSTAKERNAVSPCLVFRVSNGNLYPVGSELFDSPDLAAKALKAGKQKGVFAFVPALKIS